MILKSAITGNPVEIPEISRASRPGPTTRAGESPTTQAGEAEPSPLLYRCFPDSQATFSAFCSEEDLQPMIFPLLRIAALTPPDPCQYEFVLALVYRVITKLSSYLIPTRLLGLR